MLTSRTLFTWKQKAELWERWKNGQSVLAISRGLERRNKTGVQRIVALHGGMAPAPRRRAVAALSEEEEISRGIAAGRSIRRIASARTSPSTISREIRRTVVCRLTVQAGPIIAVAPRKLATTQMFGAGCAALDYLAANDPVFAAPH